MALLASGCGADEQPPSAQDRRPPEASDPGELMRGLVRSAAAGRYGEMWDGLDPAAGAL